MSGPSGDALWNRAAVVISALALVVSTASAIWTYTDNRDANERAEFTAMRQRAEDVVVVRAPGVPGFDFAVDNLSNQPIDELTTVVFDEVYGPSNDEPTSSWVHLENFQLAGCTRLLFRPTSSPTVPAGSNRAFGAVAYYTDPDGHRWVRRAGGPPLEDTKGDRLRLQNSSATHHDLAVQRVPAQGCDS